MIRPEQRACSLLLLLRLDDRKGSRCCAITKLQRWWSWWDRLGSKAAFIYGLAVGNAKGCGGGCCGLSPRCCLPGPLIRLDHFVDSAWLHCLLDLCAASRGALAESTYCHGTSAAGVMLCLPYLKLQPWRFRLMGRTLGWR